MVWSIHWPLHGRSTHHKEKQMDGHRHCKDLAWLGEGIPPGAVHIAHTVANEGALLLAAVAVASLSPERQEQHK